MNEIVFNGKFMFRYIHYAVLLLCLDIIFLMLAVIGSVFLFIPAVISLFITMLTIRSCLPRKIICNDEGVFYKSVSGKMKICIAWKDIQSILEKRIQYRDSYADVILQFLCYGLFSIFFPDSYRIIEITGPEYTVYRIPDYRMDGYDGFLALLREVVASRDDNCIPNGNTMEEQE